jgi:hypothetical protein|nr:MAG TPA_asm: hypothetical protein [Caudoviricetes sp.]
MKKLTAGNVWRFLKTITLWNIVAMQVGLLMCIIMQYVTGIDFSGIASAVSIGCGAECLVGGAIKVFEILKAGNTKQDDNIE